MQHQPHAHRLPLTECLLVCPDAILGLLHASTAEGGPQVKAGMRQVQVAEAVSAVHKQAKAIHASANMRLMCFA